MCTHSEANRYDHYDNVLVSYQVDSKEIFLNNIKPYWPKTRKARVVYSPLSEQQKELVEQFLIEWHSTSSALWFTNRHIYRVARIRGLSRSDIESAGSIALVQAASRYNDQHNCKFSTYALLGIKWHVVEEIRRQGRPTYQVDIDCDLFSDRRFKRDLEEVESGEAVDNMKRLFDSVAIERGTKDRPLRRRLDILYMRLGIDTHEHKYREIGEIMKITKTRARDLEHDGICILRGNPRCIEFYSRNYGG